MKKTPLITILAVILAGGLCLPVHADERADLDRRVAAMDAAGKRPGQTERDLERISKETGRPVEALKAQKRANPEMGSGGLFIANKLAAETGQPVEAIIAEHKAGKGWGQIAKENDVKLGPLVSEAKKSDKAFGDTDRPGDRFGKGAREGKAEKMDKAREAKEKAGKEAKAKASEERERAGKFGKRAESEKDESVEKADKAREELRKTKRDHDRPEAGDDGNPKRGKKCDKR